MIVIGAGIGGLASAHYLQQARPRARLLILDNHDEFGGHARRNEFEIDGRRLLGYGGSESLDAPRTRWSPVARRFVGALGIDLERLEQAFEVDLYPGLGLSFGLFFPRETYGVDRLVSGDPLRTLPSEFPPHRTHARSPAAFVADCPLAPEQQQRFLRLLTERRDLLAGQDQAAKQQQLLSMSYHDYLQRFFAFDAPSLAMFDGRTLDLFGLSARALPAEFARDAGYPGFDGLQLRRSRETELEDVPYVYHFPDGNASIARLLVRALIPEAVPGSDMSDVLTARVDYSRLDDRDRPVRLRLAATVVALANSARGVDVSYWHRDRLVRAQAGAVVYAGYSAMLPYICPELGAAQRRALAQQVRGPLVYVNVALRNWRSWVERGVHTVNNPAGFYSIVKLDYPVSLGEYQAGRAGRTQLYARSFEEFEARARDELTRMLGPGGFVAERDIAAITVNRWGHGYAYQPWPLFDGARGERDPVLSTTAVGRIHFAGTDAAWEAYADRAIDTAHRAAHEISG